MMPGAAPQGWHTITPRVFTDDPAGLVAFFHDVFEATGDYTPDRPADIRIGDSIIMVSDTAARPATGGFFYVYLNDLDGPYWRALAAGATSLEAPRETPYGDSRAMIEDLWGNTWQLAVKR